MLVAADELIIRWISKFAAEMLVAADWLPGLAVGRVDLDTRRSFESCLRQIGAQGSLWAALDVGWDTQTPGHVSHRLSDQASAHAQSGTRIDVFFMNCKPLNPRFLLRHIFFV